MRQRQKPLSPRKIIFKFGRHLHHRIIPQGCVVVEVFIAHGYGIDTLAKHLLDAVPNVTGMPTIRHTCDRRLDQATSRNSNAD